VEKDRSTVAGFAVPASVAATIDHTHHRSRRGYMNPYFSKRAIVSLEPMIHERISALCRRMDEACEEGIPINLDRAFSAMTADIITTRFYGYHYNYLGLPDMLCSVREAFLGVSTIFHLARFVPSVIPILKRLPTAIIRCILPSVADFLELQDSIKANIVKTLQGGDMDEASSRSVIIEALGDKRIPASERALDRLLDEGTVIIFAGTETSSRALAVAMFYLLDDMTMIDMLRDELLQLKETADEQLTLQQLESLPYLVSPLPDR
jgi:cytochrome P450